MEKCRQKKIALFLSSFFIYSTLSAIGISGINLVDAQEGDDVAVITEQPTSTMPSEEIVNENRVENTDSSSTGEVKPNLSEQPKEEVPPVTSNNLLDDLFDIPDKPKQPKDNQAISNIANEISGNSTVDGNGKDEKGVAATKDEVPDVKVVTTTEDEVVPFDTSIRYDATLPSGVTQVLVEGENGWLQVTVERLIADGVVQSEKRTLTYYRAPITRVIVVGTKTSRDSWHDAIRKPPLQQPQSQPSTPSKKVSKASASAASVSLEPQFVLEDVQLPVTIAYAKGLATTSVLGENRNKQKGELPKTGSTNSTLASIAGMLLLCGGLIVLPKRRLFDV